jgi:serine/threonine-protein kinase
MDGYESKSQVLDSSSDRHDDINFTLSPSDQRLQVIGEGDLSVDGGPVGRLAMGAFRGTLNDGSHVLHWVGKSGFEATFRLDVQVGKPAKLLSATHNRQAGAALFVSTASQQTRLYTSSVMPIRVDGTSISAAGSNGLEATLPAGLHTIIAGRRPHVLRSRVQTDAGRLLQIAFEDAPDSGSLTIMTNVDGVDLKLLRGATTVREGTSAEGRLDLSDLPAGNYTLQATGPASETLSPQAVLIKQGQSSTVSILVKKDAVFVPLRVQTLPGANVFVDGALAGTTGGDGDPFLASLAAGVHHVEARRGGKSAAQDVTLSDGSSSVKVAVLKFEPSRSSVSIELDPAASTLAVYDAKGGSVTVTGTHLTLPEGKYRFLASANGYLDRTEAVDVPPDGSTTVNLKLSPITVAETAPVITGWGPAEWSVDVPGHTLTHHGSEVGAYAAPPSRGTFVFSGSIGHGFLINKPKVEWVANYRDANNYLLFSLDRTGLEEFVVVSGKKIANGGKIPIPPLSKYQVMVRIVPGHIMTSLGDGHGWKQLSDWNGLPEDVDAGRFGFKGPVTLTSFSYIH